MEGDDRLEKLALALRERPLEDVLLEHWSEVRCDGVGGEPRGLVLHVPIEEIRAHARDHHRGHEKDRGERQ
jgi:hypothetical protein